MLSDSLFEKLLKQTTNNSYKQQGKLPEQHSASTTQHAPAANTELDAINVVTAETIFNSLIFIDTSQ